MKWTKAVMCDTVVGLHITAFTIAPLLSVKALDLDLFGFKILGGALVMLLGNGLLDVINEVYGKVRARGVALAAMLVRLVSYGIILAVVTTPATKDSTAFDKLMSQGFHIFMAGEATHFLIQLIVDIEVFDRIRQFFNRQGFWLRYNVSNFVSMPATNLCFVSLVVFFGWLFGKPAHGSEDILKLVAGTFLVRWPLTVLLTPLYAGLVNALRSASNPSCHYTGR